MDSDDELVDRSGGPSVFDNDGYDEPTMESDEALTHVVRSVHTGGGSAASLCARSTCSTSREGDAPYNTHIATNHDGSSCAVATTAGRVRVFARDASGALGGFRDITGDWAVNECEFGSKADPNAIVCACGDGFVRIYDTRSNDNRATVSYRAPYGETDVASASFGRDFDALVAAAVGPHVAFYDRRGSAAVVGTFQDAQSEVVTSVRFHPERREELYTSSVDSLVCSFDCSKVPLSDEDALISIMSAKAAVNNIGFCRTGTRGNERDALWAITGIEEAEIFVASSDRKRVGVQLAHLQNARQLAQTAASAVSASSEFAQVDYIISVHDGVDAGELYLSAGTQSGTVGVFPLIQGPSSARGTSAFVTLGAPVATMRNGHRDIVRSMVWDGNRYTPECARVPVTCGEDSLVCAWTPGSDADSAPPPVDRTRPSGRRHSPY